MIDSSIVDEDSDSDGVTYRAEIVYEYHLDGVKHSADVVVFGDYGASWSSHAEGIVDRYPVGKKVTVFYDPSNHDNAVLEPGTNFMVFFQPMFGLLFVVLLILSPRLIV